MNGDHTDLETSRRLAKVWPFVSPRQFAPPWGCLRWWWYPELDIREAVVEWECAEAQFDWEHDWPDDERPIIARGLAELEAKIREMGLLLFELLERNPRARATSGGRWEREAGKYRCGLCPDRVLSEKTRLGNLAYGYADHIIDALGAAVAESLEKAGEGGKKV